MTGIILAGGYATRLKPCTFVIGKTLLPIYDKPMIFYSVGLLIESGADHIIITCNKLEEVLYKHLLVERFGSYGVKFDIVTEDAPKGPAYGIYTAMEKCNGDDVVAIFGDNVFLSLNLPAMIKKYSEENKGTTIFVKEVEDPKRFGVVELDKNGKFVDMEEKPQNPKSNLAVTGLMIFKNDVFKKIETLKPSARGELETTDLIKLYLKENRATVKVLPGSDLWLDTGTHESMLECSNIVKEYQNKNGLVGCIELCLYDRGKITRETLENLAKVYPKIYQDLILNYKN